MVQTREATASKTLKTSKTDNKVVTTRNSREEKGCRRKAKVQLVTRDSTQEVVAQIAMVVTGC